MCEGKNRMEINFNPIGYNAKTEQGNNYKKSNLGKSIGLVLASGVAYAYRKKPIRLLKNTEDENLEYILKTLGSNYKLSDKERKLLQLYNKIEAVGAIFGIGVLADRYINKKRKEKADIKQVNWNV